MIRIREENKKREEKASQNRKSLIFGITWIIWILVFLYMILE